MALRDAPVRRFALAVRLSLLVKLAAVALAAVLIVRFLGGF